MKISWWNFHITAASCSQQIPEQHDHEIIITSLCMYYVKQNNNTSWANQLLTYTLLNEPAITVITHLIIYSLDQSANVNNQNTSTQQLPPVARYCNTNILQITSSAMAASATKHWKYNHSHTVVAQMNSSKWVRPNKPLLISPQVYHAMPTQANRQNITHRNLRNTIQIDVVWRHSTSRKMHINKVFWMLISLRIRA